MANRRVINNEPDIIETRCSICNRVAARIEILGDAGSERMRYEGIVAGSGPTGVPVDAGRMRLVAEAFVTPYDNTKIRAAGFYDDAGYCEPCKSFYCFDHWNTTDTGGGWCPKGHFKSLDPNWSPED